MHCHFQLNGLTTFNKLSCLQLLLKLPQQSSRQKKHPPFIGYGMPEVFHFTPVSRECLILQILHYKRRGSRVLVPFFPRHCALLEATPRFELGSGGFAVLCLTTWLCRNIKWSYIKFSIPSRDGGFNDSGLEELLR